MFHCSEEDKRVLTIMARHGTANRYVVAPEEQFVHCYVFCLQQFGHEKYVEFVK